MNRFLRALLLAIIATILFGTLNAWAIEPEITAEVRSRSEANLHRGVPPQSADDNTLNIREYLRTRLNFNLVKDEDTRAFIQLQDSRVYGGEGDGISGGLANDMNLGIHQAYIEFDHWLWHRLHSRVGRQEITYGNHRLMGNVGWSNVGRTFDAGKVSVKFDKVTLEATAATLVEADSANGNMGTNTDKMMGILAVLLPESNVEFLLIGETDGTKDTVQTDKRVLDRGTLAAYSARQFGNGFDYTANLALQGGTQVQAGVERDIEAYMVAAEIGYTLAGAGKGRLALGIDLTSGDDGKDSTKIKEFNNLYYTGHKFRGYMDNFLAPNGLSATSGKGLMDLMVRGAVNFHPAWRVGADIHVFRTAQDFVSMADSSLTKSLGTEVDAWVKATEFHGVTWQYGASIFSWTDDAYGLNRETTQLWMYTQATMSLK